MSLTSVSRRSAPNHYPDLRPRRNGSSTCLPLTVKTGIGKCTRRRHGLAPYVRKKMLIFPSRTTSPRTLKISMKALSRTLKFRPSRGRVGFGFLVREICALSAVFPLGTNMILYLRQEAMAVESRLLGNRTTRKIRKVATSAPRRRPTTHGQIGTVETFLKRQQSSGNQRIQSIHA